MRLSKSFHRGLLGLMVIVMGVAIPAGAATRYVNAANLSPVSPFTNGWGSAADTIQAALNVAAASDLILVTNGVYSTGGAPTPAYSLTNRVCITKALTVQAVSTNPADTIILGAPSPVTGGLGTNATRGVYMVANSTLIGFTITNGFTHVTGGDPYDIGGGGIFVAVASTSTAVSNCVIRGNTAQGNGGGAYKGNLFNCTVDNNQSTLGGGGFNCVFSNCTITGNFATNTTAGGGGGAYGSSAGGTILYYCTISGNRAASTCGGVFKGAVYNCTISNNRTGPNNAQGGGANQSTLINSLIVSNVAEAGGGGGYGGGTYNSYLTNCTVYGNTGAEEGGTKGGTNINCIVWGNTGVTSNDMFGSFALYTCASKGVTDGVSGNTTNNPMFVDASSIDLRLRRGSPCIDTGSNASAPTNMIPVDRAGNIRILNSVIDMGALEYVLRRSTSFVVQ